MQKSPFVAIIAGLVGVVVVAIVIFPIFAQGGKMKNASCMTTLRVLGGTYAIYSADSDDNYPPLYSFSETSGPESEQIRHALSPYLKNQSIACPKDESVDGSKTFGYVHCHSLMAVIPDYSKGKRVLDMRSGVIDFEKTPFLRDPVRGSSTFTTEGSQHVKVLGSPHEASFSIMFLDTHVRSKTPLDMVKEF